MKYFECCADKTKKWFIHYYIDKYTVDQVCRPVL
jgi:hypothetical protein